MTRNGAQRSAPFFLENSADNPGQISNDDAGNLHCAYVPGARIENRRMTIGLGAADHPDIGINGTVEDLFLKSSNPAELQTLGDTKLLVRFMEAFGEQDRTAHSA